MIKKFRQKSLNYIYNVILAEKQDTLSFKDKFHRSFKSLTIIFLLSFALAEIISNFVSYSIVPALFPNIVTNIKPYHSKDHSDSFSIIEKNIMTRNILNKTGAIPYEDTPEGSEKFLLQNFDKAPCVPNEKLPVQLVGIIYTGNPATNLVTLRDPQVTIADIYKEGQTIIDNESYSLFKVTGPVTAEFRHDKKKVCVSLNPQNFSESGAPINSQNGVIVSLDTSFVTDQLGTGFSKILNSARLVPQIIDGKTIGFKIFAIEKDSLFDKIQLVNGDIIKTVNGINLEDSSQGFKIYEAFQDENNITLEIDRNNESLIKRVAVQ